MQQNQTKEHWETVYKKPLQDIPWEISHPPEILKHLVNTQEVQPTQTLDIGCGTGNYSMYLGTQGFQVVGVDFVDSALEEANKKNIAANLHNVFLSLDVRELTKTLKTTFGFILEYSLLHHIAEEDIKDYVAQYSTLLKQNGKLLVVCYTPEHHRSNGQKIVVGKYNNAMYFRTEEEIRNLFSGLKEVWYKKTTLGKDNEHPAHAFLFEKN